MAKNTESKTTKKIGGPFLATAVFCESIMEDTSKKISALGIMDGVVFWIVADAPPGVPSEEQPISFIQNVLIVFRTGDSPGKHELRLVMERPDGKRKEVVKKEIDLSAPLHGGFQLKSQVNVTVYSQGVFWLDVILDGRRFTRMPLNVEIKRLPADDAPETPPAKKRIKS
jgi:hypothetical protein